MILFSRNYNLDGIWDYHRYYFELGSLKHTYLKKARLGLFDTTTNDIKKPYFNTKYVVKLLIG